MKGKPPLFLVLVFAAGLLLTTYTALAQNPAHGNEKIPAGKHRGGVVCLLYDGKGRVLSAGEDGFLGIWNLGEMCAEERFQLSENAVVSMAPRPGYTQIAIVESDSLGLYRISAWDYEKKKKLFTVPSRDPVSHITYSAMGTFIIASQNSQGGLLFISPETGELLSFPVDQIGRVSFTATGRSERIMAAYSPSGILSYWDLESGEELHHFSVVPNLGSPLLLGNNRFLAGFAGGALVIIDAVSGNELTRKNRLSGGVLYPDAAGSADFLYLNKNELHYYRINNSGINPPGAAGGTSRQGPALGAGAASANLETRDVFPLPDTIPSVRALVFVSPDRLALGTATGAVYVLSRRPMEISGNLHLLATGEQIAAIEGAASAFDFAFITGNNLSGIIPLNFNVLREGDKLLLTGAGSYNHIISLPGNIDSASDRNGTFLYWQDASLLPFPAIRRAGEAEFDSSVLKKLSIRLPLRSVAVIDQQALFLDSVGNITILSTETGNVHFNFSSAGSLDAAFFDGKNIIIGRGAVSGGRGEADARRNAPFLKVNTVTGETVPLPYPARVGARIFRSGSGTLYGAVISGSTGNAKTELIKLNPDNSIQSEILMAYEGEDTFFSIAETLRTTASTLGGDGAFITGTNNAIYFERSPGLPRQLISGGGFYITIDQEGNVAWHHGASGKLLAMLSIYRDKWILKTEDGPKLQGPVAYSE
jgi:WD40 repeat protein